MQKPTKPSEELPKSFGGLKENFSEDKQATGYEPDVPDVLGGANLNYTLDTIGKKDTYHDAICDFINETPINNTITVDSNNTLQYTDLSDVVHQEDMPEVVPSTKDVILKDANGNYINPYVNYNKGQGWRLFDVKFSDHILTGVEATGWALCGTYTLTTDTEFYETCVAEKEEAGDAVTIEVDNGYTFTGYKHSNGHIYYDISEKANVDSIYNVTGSAWYYGIDTDTQRIFMPRNDNFTQNSGNVSTVNNFVEHGLPTHTHERGTMNIEGYIDTYVDGSGASVGVRNASGALYPKGSGQILSNSADIATGLCGINFDASRNWTGSTAEPDSTVYGNSTTVQPRAVKQLCYICVGNVVINEEGLDVEKLEGDVRSLQSTKANIDLDNLSETGEARFSGKADTDLGNLSTDLTVGSGVKPIYITGGAVTASTNTVGSGVQPVYMNNGTITASTSSVGAGNSLLQLDSGTFKQSTNSTGSGIQPIYLSAGAFYPSSSSVGSATTPTYLNSGTITASTYSIANSRFDGQWVNSTKVLSTATAADTYPIDLSDYLPSDNYNYEVLISGGVYQNVSSTGSLIYIYSDLIKAAPGWMWAVSTNVRDAGILYPLIVNNTRKIYFKITDMKLSSSHIYAIAYRRLGTNLS